MAGRDGEDEVAATEGSESDMVNWLEGHEDRKGKKGNRTCNA